MEQILLKFYHIKKILAMTLVICLIAVSLFTISAIKVYASIPTLTNAATVEDDVKELLQSGFDSMVDVVEFKTEGFPIAEKFLSTDGYGNFIDPFEIDPILQTLFDEQIISMEINNYNAYSRLDIKSDAVSISVYYKQNQSNQITDIQITVTYTINWREAESNTHLNARQSVQDHARNFLNTPEYTAKSSDFDKLKAINNYICETFQYDYRLFVEAETDQTIYSAFQMINDSGGIGGYKRGVCQAYAIYGYIMLKEAGFEALTIDGEAGGGAHVWNMVKVGTKWYHLDFTWNDPISTVNSDPIYQRRQDGAGTVSDNYLLRADSEMSINHSWTLTQDGYTYPLSSTIWSGLPDIVDETQPIPSPTETPTTAIPSKTIAHISPTPILNVDSSSTTTNELITPSTTISIAKTQKAIPVYVISNKKDWMTPVIIVTILLVSVSTAVASIHKKKAH